MTGAFPWDRFEAVHGITAPEPAADGLWTPGADTPYGLAALRDECAKVAEATEGTRNDIVNRAAFRMGRLVSAGKLTEGTARYDLAAAARHCGLPEAEVDLLLRTGRTGGLANGQAHPRHVPDRPEHPDLPDFDPGADKGFWGSRSELTHVETFARARRSCPWAVLGVVLARVVVCVPRWCVLPPLVGADASLNLFVALVSASGGGKGASEAAAADAVQIGPGNTQIATAGVGSGEGLAHLFVKRTKDGVEQHREAVLMKVTEIDTLGALGDRKGATLLPELRKAWSGEDLGFAYADPTKALPLPAHTYRLCLVAGVQPGRAQWVLDDADGGTPQRFLWLPATDPGAPDAAPLCPPRWIWGGPGDFPMADAVTERVALPVALVARDVIDTARLARLRGDGEALDGHALLTRLKTAAALGLFTGHLEVTEEDWDLAGVVMGVSDRARAGVVAHLQRDAEGKNTRRAEAEAARNTIITDRTEAEAMKRACAYVLRRVSDAPDGLTGGELRRGCSGAVRDQLDAALEALSRTGRIEADTTRDQGRSGLRWREPK